LEVTSQALDASQKLVAAAASENQFFFSRITALRRQLQDLEQRQTLRMRALKTHLAEKTSSMPTLESQT
jgi:hypothetical protein